jgi:hypothetical protein
MFIFSTVATENHQNSMSPLYQARQHPRAFGYIYALMEDLVPRFYFHLACGMLDLCRLIVALVIDLFQPRATVEAEILVLRQQIIVLRRGTLGRVPLSAVNRMVLGWVCRLFPKTREALAIVRPDTVVRWYRAGFRRYWRSTQGTVFPPSEVVAK